MKLFIKNMVCPRCISTVENLLQKHQLAYNSVTLGEIIMTSIPLPEELVQLRAGLENSGFDLLDDERQRQIETIKNLLIKKVQDGDIEEHFSISKYISTHVHKDYSHTSKLFSAVEGITIEQFFILQKIEKIKEWLVYNQLSVNEIALRLGYSSVQHLSGQFKKITGMAPGSFKNTGTNARKPLDNVALHKHD